MDSDAASATARAPCSVAVRARAPDSARRVAVIQRSQGPRVSAAASAPAEQEEEQDDDDDDGEDADGHPGLEDTADYRAGAQRHREEHHQQQLGDELEHLCSPRY